MNLGRLRLIDSVAAFRGTFVSCPESFVSFASGSNGNLFTSGMKKSGRYCSEQRIAPCPHLRKEGHLPPAIHSFVVRTLRALPITDTELKLKEEPSRTASLFDAPGSSATTATEPDEDEEILAEAADDEPVDEIDDLDEAA
jgi:hypothetical protein